LAVDGGECSASRPGRFTTRKRSPSTHWLGGWVGPTAVIKRNYISTVLWNYEPYCTRGVPENKPYQNAMQYWP